MPYHAHGFVDGAYLRELAHDHGKPLVDPRALLNALVSRSSVQDWCAPASTERNVVLARVIYYDARPDVDADADQHLVDYWREVELLPDTELGFGSLRGGTGRRPPRQKGVDTLIAVDMLVGAFTQIYSVAVLVAGDADFVPVVNEVRRRGVMVAVAGHESNVAEDLQRAADRFVPLTTERGFPALEVRGRKWNTKR